MFTAPIPNDDSERLATLHRYSILDTGVEQGYEDITALASYICGTPFSTITLVDKDRQWFKSEFGFGVQETNRADGFCACAVMQPETMVVPDTLLDPSFAQNPFVTAGPEIRFYAGAPLVAPNGQVLGTVCVFDTRPRELAEQQIKALEALSRQVMALFEARLKLIETDRAAKSLMQTEKLAAVGRLASSMAHGINNPLEALTNLLYLSRHKSEDTEITAWLSQADLELRRVSAIANQAFHFHKQATLPQPVTCDELFQSTLDVYEARLINAGIAVEKRKLANDPVECFAGDIRHVLASILSNSIDAMPEGGRLILRSRRATNWRTGDSGLMLTIADTGAGMDTFTQHRMFEAFYSTKGIGGTGLGLWASAEIVHRHNGKIRIRSSQASRHRGTVATVFLPFLKTRV